MALQQSFLDEVKARTSLVDLIRRHVKLQSRGGEFEGLCPFHNERSPSFTVNETKGFYHCFGCGAHGDAVQFLIEHRDLDFMEAVRELADLAGLPVPGEPPGQRARPPAPVVRPPDDVRAADEAADDAAKLEEAAEILRRAMPARGTLVDTYFRARGLPMAPPRSLYFAASLAYRHRWREGNAVRVEQGAWPAMLAPMKDPEGRFCGLHRTWLARDGSAKAPVKKPKKTLGPCYRRNGAIRLTPAHEDMMAGEGIETSLSGAAPFWSGELECPVIAGRPCGVWAAGSLGHLGGGGEGQGEMHPVQIDPDRQRRLPSAVPDPARPGLVLPAECRRITLLEDADMGDPHAGAALLDRAVRRWTQIERREVLRAKPLPGTDFNDMLRGVAQ
jgi:hypothetical protein